MKQKVYGHVLAGVLLLYDTNILFICDSNIMKRLIVTYQVFMTFVLEFWTESKPPLAVTVISLPNRITRVSTWDAGQKRRNLA